MKLVLQVVGYLDDEENLDGTIVDKIKKITEDDVRPFIFCVGDNHSGCLFKEYESSHEEYLMLKLKRLAHIIKKIKGI